MFRFNLRKMRNQKPVTKRDINRQGILNIVLGLAIWFILAIIFKYF